MANFEQAYKRTAVFEGGYAAHPDDNGNWTGGKKGVGVLVGTNYGISAPVYKTYLGRTPSVEDMKNIPVSARRAIYKKHYWDIVRGDEIKNQPIANSLYDMAVNAGPGMAIIQLKRAKKYHEFTPMMTNDFLDVINQT